MILGTFKVGCFVVGIVRSLLHHFNTKELDLPAWYGKGSWVIVTGPTEGIGKCIADEFAARKFNIVLLSRSEDKLNKVGAEIAEKHGVDTRVIAMDLSKGTNPDLISKVDDQTKDIDVSIIVNNAGVISYDAFIDQDPDFLNGMLNLNAIAPALLS